jgi:hypothetical protein
MFRMPYTGTLSQIDHGCHCPSSMFRLPMSCLQTAQAVIDLFSECSGCHWQIHNVQYVISLFSKCSGYHWPLLIVQDVIYWYLISQSPGCHCSTSMFKLAMSCLQIAQAVIDLSSLWPVLSLACPQNGPAVIDQSKKCEDYKWPVFEVYIVHAPVNCLSSICSGFLCMA